MLQKELDTKNATIESQSRQLEQAHQSIQDLTAALQSAQLSAQQAQALHAGTLHKQLKEGEPEQSVVVEQADQSAPEQQPEKKPGYYHDYLGKSNADKNKKASLTATQAPHSDALYCNRFFFKAYLPFYLFLWLPPL